VGSWESGKNQTLGSVLGELWLAYFSVPEAKEKPKIIGGGLRRKMKSGVVPQTEECLPTKIKAELKPQYKNGVCV
jgi:hypothetical protein